MTAINVVSTLLIVAGLLVSIWAHPLKTPVFKAKRDASSKIRESALLHEQEKELEDLAKQQKDSTNNVVLQTSSDVKVVEENGKAEKIVKSTKNVVNGVNGDLLSSVQKLRKTELNGAGRPRTIAQTKVDIPAQGIHNTFNDDGIESEEEDVPVTEKKNMPQIASMVQQSEEEDNSEDDISDLTKSSASIAKYLLETGRFDKLEDALRDVIKIGLMTEAEAEEYKTMVLEDYEKLVALGEAEELETRIDTGPLDYVDRDYGVPYRVQNRIDPYEQAAESIDTNRYQPSQEDVFSLASRSHSGPDYMDFSDAVQPYNGYEQPQQQQVSRLGPVSPRDRSGWLNELLEQAGAAGYPEAEGALNAISNADPNSRVDQARIQRIIENIYAQDIGNQLSPEISSEEEEEERERERERERDGVRDRLRALSSSRMRMMMQGGASARKVKAAAAAARKNMAAVNTINNNNSKRSLKAQPLAPVNIVKAAVKKMVDNKKVSAKRQDGVTKKKSA